MWNGITHLIGSHWEGDTVWLRGWILGKMEMGFGRAKRQGECQHLWEQTCTTARKNHPEAWANKPLAGKPPRDFSPIPSSGNSAWMRATRFGLTYTLPTNTAFPQILTASCFWCRLLLTGSISISSLNKYNSDVWSHGGLLNWLQNAFHQEAANFPLGYRTL